MLICLDSGAADYNRLWLTGSLRGIMNFDLRVQVLKNGIHSGKGSGIVADSFMILRKVMDKLENSSNGVVKLLQVPIPQKAIDSAKKTVEILGDEISNIVPRLDGVKLMADNNFDLLMNNTWYPTCTLVGTNGLPKIDIAGNVLRSYTDFRISCRTPPSFPTIKSVDKVKTLLESNPPFGTKVEFLNVVAGDGTDVQEPNDNLKAILSKISKTYFGYDYATSGEGGSIPFIQQLVSLFPKAEFVVTGVVNGDSNIHGPNENLNLTYVKKFICSISNLIAEYKSYL